MRSTRFFFFERITGTLMDIWLHIVYFQLIPLRYIYDLEDRNGHNLEIKWLNQNQR